MLLVLIIVLFVLNKKGWESNNSIKFPMESMGWRIDFPLFGQKVLKLAFSPKISLSMLSRLKQLKFLIFIQEKGL